MLKRSIPQAHSLGQRHAGTEAIFLVLLHEPNRAAARTLVDLGASLSDVRHRVIELISGSSVPYWTSLFRTRDRSAVSLAANRRRADKRQGRPSNARELRKARKSAGMSLEELASASTIDVERLRDAESAEPRADLTFQEWLRLAVVFEGLTWEEYQAQTANKSNWGWVVGVGHMLEGMKESSPGAGLTGRLRRSRHLPSARTVMA